MSYECDRCDRWFRSANARHQHQEDKNHFAYECRCCYETWPTVDARFEHEEDDHSYYHCSECDRGFKSSNGLQMHLRSAVHTGNNMACPFCKRSFATATGVTHHLERGSCPSAPNVDRNSIYKFVRSKDPGGTISKRLLTWNGEPSNDSVQATDMAWNGRGYECYLCQRVFNSLHGLNQHLQSAAHLQDLYHCPNRACRRNFKTLAAMVNHFESESCGFMRFDQVQNGIHGMVTGRRLLGTVAARDAFCFDFFFQFLLIRKLAHNKLICAQSVGPLAAVPTIYCAESVHTAHASTCVLVAPGQARVLIMDSVLPFFSRPLLLIVLLWCITLGVLLFFYRLLQLPVPSSLYTKLFFCVISLYVLTLLQPPTRVFSTPLHTAMDMMTATATATATSTADAASASSTMSIDMDMGSGSSGASCKISMLWNWNTIDTCFISSTWQVKSRGMFAGSCIGVVCLVIVLEMLRRAVKEYDRFLVRRYRRTLAADKSSSPLCAAPGFRPTVVQQAIRALLHMAQFAVAYFVMLLAMYYNGYFIICIFIGAYIGSFVFHWETMGQQAASGTSAANEATVCCG